MNDDLKTKVLTKKDLKRALKNNLFWNGDYNITPFSINKANWIIENERIDDEDYCTIIAVKNKTLIALVNLIPDLFHVNGGQVEKFYWMTLWWVDESQKKTIIGAYLFNEALRKTKNKIIGKAYAENANGFYNKQPFSNISSRNRYTIFFCSETGNIINRFPFLKRVKPLVSFLDFVSYKIISFFNYKKVKKTTKNLMYKYITRLDNEAWDFIEPFCKDDLVFKTKNYINWQLSPQQYVSTPIDSKSLMNSPYNGTGSNIFLCTFNIKEHGVLIGFISILVINNEANLKYFICSKEKEDIVIDVLMEHLLKLKIKYIFTDNSTVVNNLKKRFTSFYIFSLLKNGIAHNDIAKNFENFELKERDGHFM